MFYNIWMPSRCVLSCKATSLFFLFFSLKEKVFGLVGVLALAWGSINILHSGWYGTVFWTVLNTELIIYLFLNILLDRAQDFSASCTVQLVRKLEVHRRLGRRHSWDR